MIFRLWVIRMIFRLWVIRMTFRLWIYGLTAPEPPMAHSHIDKLLAGVTSVLYRPWLSLLAVCCIATLPSWQLPGGGVPPPHLFFFLDMCAPCPAFERVPYPSVTQYSRDMQGTGKGGSTQRKCTPRGDGASSQQQDTPGGQGGTQWQCTTRRKDLLNCDAHISGPAVASQSQMVPRRLTLPSVNFKFQI
jgi:hypothetical protein